MKKKVSEEIHTNDRMFSLQPWVRTKTKIPVPIELLVVIGGTVASYFGHLNENYNIRIVGEIPTG